MKSDTLYYKLLKEYCDGLIALQYKGEDPAFRGGIWCRSCKTIHGRCPDGVFAFTEMYKLTREEKYLAAAQSVFDYGDNLLCTDGGLYNDAQTTWRYTTVFHLIAVAEAYEAGVGILPEPFMAKLHVRAKQNAAWLYENLDEHSPANINYCTTNGLALLLAGRLLGEAKYLQKAAGLAEYAAGHITENNLLYGECKPHGTRSARGCVAVDIGYNVEESVPALVKYACIAGDENLLTKLEKVLKSHLDFMFPDGGWDNSFGVRNNKWTYWGSRTSDGCASAYLLMAERDPAFAEAALRNTELLARCTRGGLLYGGPDYEKHGEYACTHHTFEHANAFAFVLEKIEEKYLQPKRAQIPADRAVGVRYYPEIATYKLACGEFLATVTNYDFDVPFSAHASGGTLTALYHKKTGPMIMASVSDYVLVEPTNMQQVKDRRHHRPLTPRFAAEKEGKTYFSSWYTEAEITQKENTVYVKTGLADAACHALSGYAPSICYTLGKDGMEIEIENAAGLQFILPLIRGKAEIKAGKIIKQEKIFFLTGGFIAEESTLVSDESGRIIFHIYAEQERAQCTNFTENG